MKAWVKYNLQQLSNYLFPLKVSTQNLNFEIVQMGVSLELFYCLNWIFFFRKKPRGETKPGLFLSTEINAQCYFWVSVEWLWMSFCAIVFQSFPPPPHNLISKPECVLFLEMPRLWLCTFDSALLPRLERSSYFTFTVCAWRLSATGST